MSETALREKGVLGQGQRGNVAEGHRMPSFDRTDAAKEKNAGVVRHAASGVSLNFLVQREIGTPVHFRLDRDRLELGKHRRGATLGIHGETASAHKLAT